MHLRDMSEAVVVQSHGRLSQRGQSVVEALLALSVLGSLVVAIAWLGRLQDVALQAQHASRRTAFAGAHQGLDPSRLARAVDGYLDAPGHVWRDRRGEGLVAGEATGLDTRPLIHFWNTDAAPLLQVGDPIAGADQWRRELQLGEAGVWRADVSLRTRAASTVAGALRDFDQQGLNLHRHTAILLGSGEAGSDIQVQDRLASSTQAWGSLAARSREQGRVVQQRMNPLDMGWNRTQPEWDWTSHWAAEVPSRYLKPWRQP